MQPNICLTIQTNYSLHFYFISFFALSVMFAQRIVSFHHFHFAIIQHQSLTLGDNYCNCLSKTNEIRVKSSPNGNAKHFILMEATAHSSLRYRKYWVHSAKQKFFLCCAITISHSHAPSLTKQLHCSTATWNFSRVCTKDLIRTSTKSWNI